jgi:twitching motility two-component system response regulator PilH
MKTWLEKGGYTVLTAANAEEGLKRATEAKPDAIVMDVVMPGMSGFQATRQLTKDDATAHIPVVIVTTKDQETDKVWGKRQGATDYLVKPVNEQQLVGAIKKVLGG